MRLQKLAAALGLVLGAASAVAAGAFTCDDECERMRAEHLTICAKISPENQERCRQHAAEEAAACHRACVPSDVDKCKRGCDRKASAGHKECAAMPQGSPERAKCRQAVEEQRSACYRDCERKGR